MEVPGRAPKITGPSTGYSPPERSLRTGLSIKGGSGCANTPIHATRLGQLALLLCF